LLITDLDDDGHPEVTAILWDKPPIWVRFPFDKPSRLRFENCWAIQMMVRRCQFVPKALPVWTVDRRLRLLRWKDGKAILKPLPNLPDVPMENAFVGQGEGTETVFLRVYRGENVWVFVLSPQDEWQFASRFTSQAIRSQWYTADWYIADLADLDRDGFWDALCLDDADADAWVSWGGRGEETVLGNWMRYGSPQVADLDGDGWMEIVMVAVESCFFRLAFGLKVGGCNGSFREMFGSASFVCFRKGKKPFLLPTGEFRKRLLDFGLQVT
jgi:hypothetical protein